jgi:hypothetical protein
MNKPTRLTAKYKSRQTLNTLKRWLRMKRREAQ